MAESQSRTAKAHRTVARQRVVRIATIALAVVGVVAALFALFDGPVAGAWNKTRRQQLASQWSATRPHVGRGNAVALLQIPGLRLNLPIAEGDTPQQLRSGPGHRVGTPMPGDVGNSVVVGHGAAWGGPFAHLGELKRGDLIAMQTKSASGPIGVFKVLSVRTISGNDVSPFLGSTDRRLTLVAGTGGRFSDTRIAVTAVSGKVGREVNASPPAYATTSGGSAIWNAEVGFALAGIALAAGLVLWMRSRYRRSTIAVVVIPFLTLAVLAMLLNVDAALPALR